MSSHIQPGNSSKLEALLCRNKFMPVDNSRAEVFSGGAFKGFYYAGYIKAKEELGLTDVQLKSKSKKYGVSIGSLFAAIDSVGWPYRDIKSYIKENKSLLRHVFDRFNIPLLSKEDLRTKYTSPTIIDGKEFRNGSLFNTKHLKTIINDFVGDATFKDLKDLTIMACEYNSANPVYFNYENYPDVKVAKAILSSASIPGIFPMVELGTGNNAKYLVDGGWVMNMPIERPLTDARVKDIVAIDLINFSKKNPSPMPANALQSYVDASYISGSKNIRLIFDYLLHRDYEQSVKDQIFKSKVYDELKNGKIKRRFFPKDKNMLLVNPKIDSEYLIKTDQKHLEHLITQGYEECKPLLGSFEKFK